ncbi:sialidase family protein [Planctomicrobium sp. SH661]|uniref:sialidase family protein n=1 Tax=Planctomicrobium sp. SH661 TaxID=3448124 RepID=UPI003F5BDB07
MKLVQKSTIFRGVAGTPQANCCFPSIVALSNGELLANWRCGSQKDSADGQILLSRSSDKGKTWEPATVLGLGEFESHPAEPHYAPLTVLAPDHLLAAAMWVDRSEPGLPFFHPDTEGLLPVKTLFCESLDGGRSWSNHRLMDDAPYQSPMPVTGPVLKINGGQLACQFEVNKNYRDEGEWRHCAAWKISSDGGETWPDNLEIANDPTGKLMYWDAHSAVRQDGTCLAAFWTYDRQQEVDAPIHLSISFDWGRTWSRPRNTRIAGQVGYPVFLEDGRLLFVYLDRFQTRSIRAALSDDLGETFHSHVVIYEHPNPGAREEHLTNSPEYLQQMNLWTFGRIEAALMQDGQVAVTYYAGTSQSTSIYCAILSPGA